MGYGSRYMVESGLGIRDGGGSDMRGRGAVLDHVLRNERRFGPDGYVDGKIEERLPSSYPAGRARLVCHVCKDEAELDGRGLINNGWRCECGRLDIPARPRVVAAQGKEVRRREVCNRSRRKK